VPENVDILVGIGQETPPNVFCRYLCQLWGCSHDGIARDVRKPWTIKSAGKLYAGRRGARWERVMVTMAMAMSVEGGGMRRDLIHF